jgi:hypothetical protein
MSYSTCLHAVLASHVMGTMNQDFRALVESDLQQILACVLQFATAPITPASTAAFEQNLASATREMNRHLVSATYNQIEIAAAEQAPKFVDYEATNYRRLRQATPNRHVATLFGTITLWRHGYRPSDRDSAEATIFPLEQTLGLMEGATPALTERVGYYLAEAGATQSRVLDRLRQVHGVVIGVQRLRDLTTALDEALSPHRHALQLQRLLALLERAQTSQGGHKPVLSVGRDGITLPLQPASDYEVGSTGTVTVYDRRGERLGTVYLGYVPESGQGTMSEALTQLIQDVLRSWQGPLPRLCYVTDAGDNETAYFKKVLQGMRHPTNQKPLEWYWIVDYYHAAQRIGTMAEALFGAESGEGAAWARKMRKLLKKPDGVVRMLYSAAALKSRRGVAEHKAKAFRLAYNYIRDRLPHLNYAEFKRLGLPIGSGVTEAACKTVFTQRLKLSGMSWDKKGAQVILNLRVMLLSGIWDEACREMLQAKLLNQARTQSQFAQKEFEMAA